MLLLFILLFWWSPFIPSRNLDKVLTYNHIALMFIRSRSRVKASMILTRADHLFIHNYIRSILVITSKYYYKTYYNGPDGARTRVLLIMCLAPCQLSHTGSWNIYTRLTYSIDDGYLIKTRIFAHVIQGHIVHDQHIVTFQYLLLSFVM